MSVSRDTFGKGRSVDKFHDETDAIVGLQPAVHVRDVRMVQRRQDLRFTLESRVDPGRPSPDPEAP